MATRRKIKIEYGIEGFREGAFFSSPTMDGELATVKISDVPASTVDTTNASLPLKQYCIKGAYNAPITGNFVNIEMIKYLFYRGCRFLDFEVFSFDGEPYVAMSTDNTYTTINTTNKISLQEILTTVFTYAFSTPSQIQKDPVFLHFRIKTNQTKLYDKIGSIIGYVLKDKMYIDKSGKAISVTGDTILKDIRGKFIIVLDKTYAPTYKYESKLGNYVNMETGYDVLRKYSYSDLSHQQYTSPFVYADGLTTDISIMKIVMPDMGLSWTTLSRNNIYYPMVLNYGAQIVLYPFYQVDQYLEEYEQAFADRKAGFVPMGAMVTYLKGKVEGDSSIKPISIISENTIEKSFSNDTNFSTDIKKEDTKINIDNVKQNLKNITASFF